MSEEPTVVDGKRKPSGLEQTEVEGRASAAPAQRAVGRFLVERTLGAGGMGVVLLALDPTLDRRVAIKLLHEDDGAGSSGRVRMLREAQAMARLRHPNVVDVYEAGLHDGNVFLVMEYVDGGNLRARLPSLDRAAILRAFYEAGQGLAAAHRAGLVHRDFKPDNVLIDEHGHAKVTDFGLAARDDSVEEPPRPSAADLDALSHTLTRTGEIMGTPRYMAPEQHLGGTTDARTDQFSFCVALYEALFGDHPFRAETREALHTSVTTERPREPAAASSRVTEAILRGLSRKPADRFPDMDTLLAELVPRNRRALFAAIGIGALALGVAVFALTRPVDDPVGDARRLALASDSEMLDVQLPAGTQVDGLRAAGNLGARLPATWLPTGQLGVPRGAYVIDYRDGAGTYAFAVISRGGATTRTLALPAPERVDGYAFVPGGEVEIGDADNQPIATVLLAPYLIAQREEADHQTYADALRIALDRHARLPTAGEWEWAARLGLAPTLLQRDEWEWTASEFEPYPYAADDRDDPFAARDRSEVRGGADRLTARRAGAQRGKAQVRLVRTARSVPPLESVTLELVMTETTDAAGIRQRTLLPPREHARLSRFLLDWIQLADRPSLRVEGGDCEFTTNLLAVGVPYARLEQAPANVRKALVLRWNPDRAFSRPGRPVICDSENQILDGICFDGDRIHPASSSIVEAVASTLIANESLMIEVQAYVGAGPDAKALSQRRAELVRDRLVASGVAKTRLRARGYGVGADPGAIDHGLFSASSTRMPAACQVEPGERIAFTILRK